MTISASLPKALLQPASIALVGASADLKKNNSRPQRFLKRFGYEGRVFPINPGREEIFGERAYPDLGAVPAQIDHVFVMVPAAAAPAVIDQACELKIPVATLFTAGFAELGEEGLKRQRDLVARAREGGMRILGPNCMGMVNVHDRIPLTVNAVIERETLVPGPVSLVSQSGSVIGSILSRAQARGVGFSKLISVGNEADLGVGELANMLVDDKDTGAILLFLETFRDADRLAAAARRAYAVAKPVIAYKLGRSGVGRRVATSHTGAMTGLDEIANAFFREHGIMRVDTFEGLFECVQLVMRHKPPRGRRVSVVTGTGGAAAMVVDRLGALGADVVGPSPEVIAALRAKHIEVSDAPLIDLPMGQSDGGRYSTILSTLLASDHTDAVVSVIGSSAQNPQTIVDRVFAANHRDDKPLAVFLAPRADDALAHLQKNGVASFRTPESCADAVNAYLNWHAPVERLAVTPEVAQAQQALRGIASERLTEREAATVFRALGIPSARCRIVQSAADPIDLTGPFAVKLVSPDVPHKTEAGMVKIDVPSERVTAEVTELLTRAGEKFPKAAVHGVMIQEMERGLAEVIVGFRRDPEVGPIVMLAMGGIAAELTKGMAVRIAPVSIETARGMIEDVPALCALAGFRNLPRGDLNALAHAIRAMSLLAAVERRVTDAEINPLIVKPDGDGVVAVDGLLVMAQAVSP